jgi:hypothetical protein
MVDGAGNDGEGNHVTAGGSPNARNVPDRRERPTPMISRYLFVGSRRGGRRAGETANVYVDRPGFWAIGAFVALVVLSLADGYFTLYELSRGGTEANPVMRAALELGSRGFVALKTVVTVLGAGFLCLHKNWRLGRACLWFAVAGYLMLTAWHLYGVLVILPSLGG